MARRLTVLSRVAVAAAAVTLPATLSGCAAGDARTLAQKACRHVQMSLASYRSAQAHPGTPEAAMELSEAEAQLRQAEPLAATAAGEDSEWQALMTTLSDTSRLPESTLMQALQAQCSLAWAP